MTRFIVYITALILPLFTFGQDIHFSQFFHSPINTNPALTGQFDGDYRGVANFRTQWNSVSIPYNTIGLAGDARGFMSSLPGLHGGFSILHDKTGDSRFKTQQFNVSGAYEIPLTSDSVHAVSGGLQVGITNRNIDYNALTFDNQYNGYSYDPNLGTGESFARNSRVYGNFNFGGVYKYKPEDRKYIVAGVAFHDLTSPKQSFYNDLNIKLDRRVTLHATGNYPITKEIDLQPGVQMMFQGTYKEIIIGTNAKYNMFGKKAVIGGIWYRNSDAFYLLAGYQQDNIIGAISYDVNVSGLKPASNMRGALEIGIIYVFKKYKPTFKRYRTCPNYL